MPETTTSQALTAINLETPKLRRRMLCLLYEGILMFGVASIAGLLFSTLAQTHNAMNNRHPLQAFLFVIFGIYFTWFWAKGQTLAMKTWHIRLVDRFGAPVTQGRALLRYALSYVWLLPPLVMAALLNLSSATMIMVMIIGWVLAWAVLSRFHPQHQFWHDAWAGTRLCATTTAP